MWHCQMNNQEQLDDLIIDDLKIYQRQDQFRFSFDAIALVHFCRFNQRHRYIDLGTGTGVLPLIGTSLGAGHITGVEINDVMANMAERSVLYNHKSNVVSIVQGDYCTMNYQQFGSKPFDGILVNPPYFDHRRGEVPNNHHLSLALHDGCTSIDDVCTAASRLIKNKGRLWMVYSAPRLSELIHALTAVGFAVKRIRMVHGMIHKPAKIVLIEAIKGGEQGLIVEPPLIVYSQPNVYTEEVSRWYERK